MRTRELCLMVVALLIVALSPAAAIRQVAERGCNTGTSGDACVYDVVATENDSLTVATRANREGDLWRAMIVEVGTETTRSNVGTGSTTDFTGAATSPIVTGNRYEVIVIYEGPLPGTFPTSAVVQFTGPGDVSPRRPIPFPPLPQRYVGVQFAGLFDTLSFDVSADKSHVARIFFAWNCGDRFPVTLNLSPDVLPINIDESGRLRFSARDIPVSVSRTLGIDGFIIDADGFDGNSEETLGGLLFTAGPLACPHRWWATTNQDNDLDGWNNRAEIRLGSNPNSRASTPEHREVPIGLDLQGDPPCADFIDNDLDELIDDDDPGCAPLTAPGVGFLPELLRSPVTNTAGGGPSSR